MCITTEWVEKNSSAWLQGNCTSFTSLLRSSFVEIHVQLLLYMGSVTMRSTREVSEAHGNCEH